MSDVSFFFLRPAWLLAALPAGLIWWRLWARRDARTAWKGLIAPHLLDSLLVVGGHQPRIRPLHLLALAWGLSILALAGPAWEREPAPFADDEAGLVVLMKVSPSMLATDVQPTRLDRAKHKLRDLMARRESGTTGLIAYSGTAHLVLPLTRDRSILTVMAEALEPSVMPEEGDVLTDALRMAEELVSRTDTTASVVVLADGVAPGQESDLTAYAKTQTLPVQFLAVQPPGTETEPGLRAAARELGASVTALAINDTDVQALARQAKRDLRAAASAQGGERWRDAGYWVLPLVGLVAVAWGRKGWVVT